MYERVIESKEWRWILLTSVVLTVLMQIPFAWAFAVAAPDRVFMGTLINPIDGASYLAKMHQGFEGSWAFLLPFTPEAHEGVFLFTFYLGLGHLSRLLNVSLILVFHTVRVLGTVVMLLTIYQFMSLWTLSINQRRLAWAMACFGVGVGGWVVLLTGYVPVDVLVLPEAFPYQAGMANPHFPWAIAIATWLAIALYRVLFQSESSPEFGLYSIGIAVSAMFLVSVSPFVLVPIGGGYALVLIRLWHERHKIPLRELNWGTIVIIFGLPLVALATQALSSNNPVFNQWMAQNQTPSPPVWDYLAGFTPLLLLAAIGLWMSVRQLNTEDLFLVGWFVTGSFLLYAPLGLQRRFSIGLILPLSVFAARGLYRVLLPRLSGRWGPLVIGVLVLATLPTLALTFLIPMVGALTTDAERYYFVTSDEAYALEYLDDQPGGSYIVLASPDMGLFIPTVGQHVIYGHPYETLNAAEREMTVQAFFTGESCDVLVKENPDLIWVGPREQALAALSDSEMCPIEGDVIYTSPGGTVRIYER